MISMLTGRSRCQCAIGSCAAALLLGAGCTEADQPYELPAHPESELAAAADRPAASPSAPERLGEIVLFPAYPKLTFQRPVQMVFAAGDASRVFIVEQHGLIRVLENRADVESAGVFLDIRDRVLTRDNEEGLLSLVFHPQFKSNGYFYVFHSAADPRRNVIKRFKVAADDPSRADPSSEKVILDLPKPYGNHNGSTLLFGPDGYLYFSTGDGGAAGDPQGNGQKLGSLLAKIHRIDVDREEDGKPYGIPKDNPFVDQTGARGEIWAYGLRNVWRMSFDRDTGDLWAGDVGQNAWEEIDLITKSGNYGWSLREGKHNYRQGQTDVPLIDPIAEYSHQHGLSVTGGYVYRGKEMPRLVGVYLYADYVSGRIWGLKYENRKVIASGEVLRDDQRPHVASFGESPDGELYICAFNKVDGTAGRIYKISQR